MRTVFTIILLIAAGIMYGQISPQITLSSEKVKVDGEVMFVHKVKSGETLYSISKAYNVSIDEIVRRNESLKAGLKEGSIIYIPSSAPAQTAVATAAPLQDKANDTSVQPSAQVKKEYDLKKYSRKKKHTVKWWETLEDVARKYNVSAEDIVELNSLETTLLKKKQVLYIPNNDFLKLQKERISALHAVKTESQDFNDTVKLANNGEMMYEYSSSVSEDIAEFKKLNISLEAHEKYGENSVKIGYILPLNLSDTIGANSNFMDFYAGSLLAVNSMQEKGMAVNLSLIDQNMFNSISDMIAAKEVDETFNFVIGPVRASDMSVFLKEFYTGGYTPYRWHTTNIISPMDMNGEKLIEGNEMFIHAPASQKSQITNLVKLFADKVSPEKNAIIIYEKDGADTTLVNAALSLLDTLGIQYRKICYGILEGRDILNIIKPSFQPQMENLVMVLSNSEAFVSDAVRNMNLLHNNPMEENRRHVTLFGTARWRNFETIEVDYFHRMNLHLSLPYFVDYTNTDVKDFLMKYRALYNCEPTPFAFQGYDITKYFLNLHKKYGKRFNCAFELGESKMLQSKFNFVQKGSQLNGFENTGTVNIMYNNDYTISVIE